MRIVFNFPNQVSADQSEKMLILRKIIVQSHFYVRLFFVAYV